LRRFEAFAAGTDQVEGAQYSQALSAVNAVSRNKYEVHSRHGKQVEIQLLRCHRCASWAARSGNGREFHQQVGA
jgi:hypothetical protein